MVGQISTGLTADAEVVAQDPGLADAEDAQGRDQAPVEVAGDVAHHRNLDPAAAPRATAREAEAGHHATARGVEAVTTRDPGLALPPVTAGADQSPEEETRRNPRRNPGASRGRRRTRAGTSLAPEMDRPPLGTSLALGISLVPDLRPHGRPSSLHTVDCDASSKLHHRLWPLLEKAIIVAGCQAALPLISLL